MSRARPFPRIPASPFPRVRCLEAMKGVEPLSSGLQDRRSFYPIELHRRNFGGAKRSRTSTSCLQGRHHEPLDHSPGKTDAEKGGHGDTGICTRRLSRAVATRVTPGIPVSPRPPASFLHPSSFPLVDRVTRIELAKSCLEGRLSAVREALGNMEPLTGLEPALIDVRSVAPFHWTTGANWSDRWDLNPRPQPWHGCAIPDYATAAFGSRGGNRTRDVLVNSQTPTANIGPLNKW